MKWLAWLLLAVSLNAAPSEAVILEYLKDMEGYRHIPYTLDSQNVIVGVGHNLTANNEKIKDYYTTREIAAFFRQDLAKALKAARKGIRDFDAIADDAQIVVIGLIWSVGEKGFMDFVKFRQALSNREYMQAAFELYNSKWYYQVHPERAEDSVKRLVKNK